MKRTITLLLALPALLLLGGCPTATTTKELPGFQWPAGLEECRVYKMTGSNGDTIQMVHCPGKSALTTNYSEKIGKTTNHYTVVTIDGVEYAPSNPVNKGVSALPPEPPASTVINGVEYVRKPQQ